MATTENTYAKEVRAWFKNHDWDFKEGKTTDGDVAFLTRLAASEGLLFKGYMVEVVCRSDHIQTVFVPPIQVKKKFFPAVSEYFGRINSMFRVGKWVLDYRDGEPRWEYLKEVEKLEPGAEEVMDDLIGFSALICNRYAEGIIKIIMGSMTPEEACKDARLDALESESADKGNHRQKLGFDSQ